MIIKQKLRYLWTNPYGLFGQFDLDRKKAKDSDYAYDPLSHVSSEGHCEQATNTDRCTGWTSGDRRRMALDFRERKALRLVFHDCIPYEDENGVVFGGCDGCLNFDENVEDNSGLQYTAAILVRKSFLCCWIKKNPIDNIKATNAQWDKVLINSGNDILGYAYFDTL